MDIFIVTTKDELLDKTHLDLIFDRLWNNCLFVFKIYKSGSFSSSPKSVKQDFFVQNKINHHGSKFFKALHALEKCLIEKCLISLQACLRRDIISILQANQGRQINEALGLWVIQFFMMLIPFVHRDSMTIISLNSIIILKITSSIICLNKIWHSVSPSFVLHVRK